MTEPKIIITRTDRQRLEHLLVSAFARGIERRAHLDALRFELRNAEIVASEDIADDVITMNSTVRLYDKEQALIKAEYQAEFGVEDQAPTVRRLALNATLLLVGLGLLISGSNWFVESAVVIARKLGVSELIIGLTIVAAGTSLPEVATSVIAAIRGESIREVIKSIKVE